MNKKLEVLAVLLSAIMITFLFHKKEPGLNLVIAESLIISWLFLTRQIKFKFINEIIVGAGFIITSVFTILTHSSFSYIIHFIALFLFVGILTYPNVKSLINTIGISFYNLLYSQIRFLNLLSASKVKGHKVGGFIKKSRIFIIPVLIIILFIFIYRKSNPFFDKLVIDINASILQNLNKLFKDFDFLIILTFLISTSISVFIFFRDSNQHLVNKDILSSNDLKRGKNIHNREIKMTALKNEYNAGIFLLITLNAILLILNIIDINWVWFNFEWEGQYLKQFVHEGTYLLLLSILISIALVLYFFRGSINFYKRNSLLKNLSFIWIVQNAVLTISVAIRNFYYINYFSLAYKRIGVIIFLLLTIYGLYTVYIKVYKVKSAFYLFKTNILALYIVLVISSCINWDNIIAKYNFTHANKSFLHLDYLSTLSDKALPDLSISLSELNEINTIQKRLFPFEHKFMTPESYYSNIENRKQIFIKKWDTRSILEWNLPEYLAYKKLKSVKN